MSSDTTDGSRATLPAGVAPPPHMSLGLTGQHSTQELYSTMCLQFFALGCWLHSCSCIVVVKLPCVCVCLQLQECTSTSELLSPRGSVYKNSTGTGSQRPHCCCPLATEVDIINLWQLWHAQVLLPKVPVLVGGFRPPPNKWFRRSS